MKKVYLDYAATTPVDTRVVKAMNPYFSDSFGNASSLHSFGRQAQKALEDSRKIIAQSINAQASEIFFTSSATESNNLALQGIAMANKNRGNHIIISSIEHASVDQTVASLEQWGFDVTRLPVNKEGIVDVETLKQAIGEKTTLVSVIHVSNEIGTIQPIEEIGKICREKNVYFHTDAVQSLGKLALDVKKMNIDLLTASAHKVYGPKGAAMLYMNNMVKIAPMLHGGGQEQGMRSSTVNVPAIVGFAEALKVLFREASRENKRLQALRDKIIKNILRIPGAHFNGSTKQRVSNNVHVWFEGIDGESLVTYLDLAGFACSTGAACAAGDGKPSHVLLALGLNEKQAQGSLRISLGRQTTQKEVNAFLKILPKTVEKLRKIK